MGLASFVDNREMYRRCGSEMDFCRGESKVLRRDAHRLGVPITRRESNPYRYDSEESAIAGVHESVLVTEV